MHFGDAEKLRELFRRFGSRQLAEDHAALEFAINTKRGAVELMLGETQLHNWANTRGFVGLKSTPQAWNQTTRVSWRQVDKSFEQFAGFRDNLLRS
jgi:hypothetical protein